MFVRKKENKSGSVSVQIISKQRGAYRVAETIGCTREPDRIAQLMRKAKDRIANPEGQQKLFSVLSPDGVVIENFLEQVSNADIRTIGPELIFGKLFDRIGFSAIPDALFRHIVIARLAFPASKLKTVDYLYRYQGIRIEVDQVYRFLDRLNNNHKAKVERIAYERTKKTLRGNITVVFYDMTTLYFEVEDEDDLRNIGFSKDGKFQKPQIMLGLLVGEKGLPIGYDIFQGNTFEGHTLMPTLSKIRQKYGFSQPIVVADAAMLSKQNIDNLHSSKYKFIIGARIKNETDEIKKKILTRARAMNHGCCFSLKKKDRTRLVVTYSDKRATKDKRNRERGLRKLRQKIKAGALTKEHINNRGYNKFLKIAGKISVEIDESKVKEDERWDGLKGYATNTGLRTKNIVANYGHLWQIEKAFRISKTDLRVRPIFHQLERRIAAHICVSFVAYSVYKELELLLQSKKVSFSVKRASELTHNMYELRYIRPGETKQTATLLKMDNEQQVLYDIVRKSS